MQPIDFTAHGVKMILLDEEGRFKAKTRSNESTKT
ncbi:hypothetical protein GBAR_LOCUS20535 [Geodia barretti]|uniref:Uncharacterized protein n=1 Tax=Geodia barretti TaxID=519541 RepID=A0AA35X1Q5_GEOBA|nr:hypothetical protein GBAR_LOCUS20535 [Geodia barretti]